VVRFRGLAKQLLLANSYTSLFSRSTILHMMKDMFGDEFNRPYGTPTIHSLSVPALKCRAKFIPSLTGRKLEIGYFGKQDLPGILSLKGRKPCEKMYKLQAWRFAPSVTMYVSEGPAGILDSMSRSPTERNEVGMPGSAAAVESW
jgi:hypothetical protein